MDNNDIQADVLIMKELDTHKTGYDQRIFGTATSYSKNVQTVEACINYGTSLFAAFNTSRGYWETRSEGRIACTGPDGNIVGSAALFRNDDDLQVIQTFPKVQDMVSGKKVGTNGFDIK